MAIYHFNTRTHSRAKGHSAVAAAAYRSGQVLYDERTGEYFDWTRYRKKHGATSFAEIFLPDDAHEHFYAYDDEGRRFADRSRLWNGAEASEKTKAGAYKKSAAIARDTVGALPHELTAEERAELVRDFARWMVARYGTGVDASIHAPDKEADERNWHVHFLQTTRTIGKEGFGGKAELELDGKTKSKLGYATGKEQIREMRGQWADHVNAALEKAGHEARVTEKSYKDQGIDKIPTTHKGAAATQMERRGEPSDRGDINREIKAANDNIAAMLARLNALAAQQRQELARQAALRRDWEGAQRRQLEAQRLAQMAMNAQKQAAAAWQQREAEAAQRAQKVRGEQEATARQAKEEEVKKHWQIDRLQAEKAEAQRQMEARQGWLFKWVFRGRLREAENDYQIKSGALAEAQKGYDAALQALGNPSRQHDHGHDRPAPEYETQRPEREAAATPRRPEAERSAGRDSPTPEQSRQSALDRAREALNNATARPERERLTGDALKAVYDKANDNREKSPDVSRAWGRAAKEHDQGKDHDIGLER